jgi:hypothetical protein
MFTTEDTEGTEEIREKAKRANFGFEISKLKSALSIPSSLCALCVLCGEIKSWNRRRR